MWVCKYVHVCVFMCVCFVWESVCVSMCMSVYLSECVCSLYAWVWVGVYIKGGSLAEAL